jgi:hypothetical protein
MIASRNLINLGGVFKAITNKVTRVNEAAKKGDNRLVIKEMALLQRSLPKIALVVQHNTKVLRYVQSPLATKGRKSIQSLTVVEKRRFQRS